MFLTTLYQQNVESGQEHVILLVGAGVVTGSGLGVGKGVGCCVLVEMRLMIRSLGKPLGKCLRGRSQLSKNCAKVLINTCVPGRS